MPLSGVGERRLLDDHEVDEPRRDVDLGVVGVGDRVAELVVAVSRDTVFTWTVPAGPVIVLWKVQFTFSPGARLTGTSKQPVAAVVVEVAELVVDDVLDRDVDVGRTCS